MASQDTEKVRNRIFEYLIEKGFKVDSDVLTQYITLAEDAAEVKIDKVKRLITNGAQVKADCLDNYILSLDESSEFSEVMFDLLTNGSITIGFKAYSKFLLYCKDIDKVRHNSKLATVFSGDLNSLQTTVEHNGDSVTCNLLQAYVLISADCYETAKAIVSDFSSARIKMNTEISVNGTMTKFKKYVGKEKSELSPLTLQLCEESRMFSLF